MSNTPYNQLADEYYDERHKTCRNFDVATTASIALHPPRLPRDGLVLEVGCGRGRTLEFLGLPAGRTVQLDASARMLALRDRESCLLQVLADATSIPLADSQFSSVVGFLIDPFLGLNFFSEAYRLLRNDGVLFCTTPSWDWATALRGQSGDELEARFVTNRNTTVLVPSYVTPKDQIRKMLVHCGFSNVTLHSQGLPIGTMPISPDIERAATNRGCALHDLQIVDVVRAEKIL